MPRTSVPEAPRSPATLHLLCGKIAAGKSTLAARLASTGHTVRIREDDWLSALYPDEIRALDDYVRCTTRLRAVMGPHVVALLTAGVSVVLDFPSNTVSSRQWARTLFEAAGAPHRLHLLDIPDEECKRRLRARNASGAHPFQTSDAEFDRITRHFAPPTEDEGFHVVRHTGDAANATDAGKDGLA